MASQIGAARIGYDDLQPALGSVLHPGGGHRVVARCIGADHQNQLGVLNIAHLIADRAGAYAFEQRRHTGGVAQARAVIHVVGAKAGAHQFLEQIGFFVAALG